VGGAPKLKPAAPELNIHSSKAGNDPVDPRYEAKTQETSQLEVPKKSQMNNSSSSSKPFGDLKSPVSQHHREAMDSFRSKVHAQLKERINFAAAHNMNREQLKSEISSFVFDVAQETNAQLNAREQQEVADALVDDMIGLGPLEVLLADESTTDIMVNNAKEIFVEKNGRLEKTNVTFVDENHLLQIARRIANRIGRRIDEASPMVDARLADGSRVNIIVPPLALDGTSISIRKFSKDKITLDQMVATKNLSASMARVLKIASACRLNVLVSGGTGSGKTTLLNALSQLINPKERIVTIEDAAELKLQQPHVVRLESRPANIEGEGEITIRDLMKNSLRMRPDRIIVGEVRGDETIDMMQAMNTGHDGSMSTIHANRPREVLRAR
jgi:pilus assembly protein CpaF